MKSVFVSCLTLAVVVALCSTAQARPGYATSAGNSCSGCHTNESIDRMDVTGDELLDIDDLSGRGPLQTFVGVKPGDTVPLTMLVTNGGGDDFHFVVQLKRFEKTEATGGPAMPQDMARWAADNPGWYLQDKVWPVYSGESGQTTTPHSAPYFTSSRFDGEHWEDQTPQPNPRTFNLFVPDSTEPGYYDFEFAVAGMDGGLVYSDEHFYVQVVPEPGTFVLLGTGLCALGLCVWRRRKKAA